MRKPTRTRRALRAIQRGLSVIRHPIGITCGDCGFIDLDGREVTSAERIMFALRGSTVMPGNAENLRCSRSLWTTYDLTYSGASLIGIFDELETRRCGCPGYHAYVPGWTPAQHLEFVVKAAERKHSFAMMLFSAVVGGAIALLVARLTR